MLKERKVKANEQKSGHNGAETIYNRCVEEKSEARVMDGRKQRGGAERSLSYSLMLQKTGDRYHLATLDEYYAALTLNDDVKLHCVLLRSIVHSAQESVSHQLTRLWRPTMDLFEPPQFYNEWKIWLHLS